MQGATANGGPLLLRKKLITSIQYDIFLYESIFLGCTCTAHNSSTGSDPDLGPGPGLHDPVCLPLMFYIERIDWPSQLLKRHMNIRIGKAFSWCFVVKKLIAMF
jgi:hypothetical protein